MLCSLKDKDLEVTHTLGPVIITAEIGRSGIKHLQLFYVSIHFCHCAFVSRASVLYVLYLKDDDHGEEEINGRHNG